MTVSRLDWVQFSIVRDIYGEIPGKPFKARAGILGLGTFMRWVEETELSKETEKIFRVMGEPGEPWDGS